MTVQQARETGANGEGAMTSSPDCGCDCDRCQQDVSHCCTIPCWVVINGCTESCPEDCMADHQGEL